MFNLFPYTDAHELNLDMILALIKKMHQEWTDFQAVNAITNAGQWDITKQYQAWTVVSDNNIGYISLKAVPAGVAITNTEYWGLIADYDILITNLSARISALEEAVDKLKNRFFVFIGDSYSLGTSGGVPVTNFGWVDQVINYLDLSADQYVRCTQADLGSYAAFYPTESGHTSWRDSMANIVARMTSDQIKKVTDVVCCGGYNECFASDISDTYTGMRDYINYVRTVFPGATYWLGEIGMNTGVDSYGITKRNYILANVIPTYRKGSTLGFKVMMGTDNILWNNTQTTDTVHPTEGVYKSIGCAIANNLLGLPSQYFQDIWSDQTSITLATGYSFVSPSDETITFFKTYDGNYFVSVRNYILIEDANPSTLYPITDRTIGTYSMTYTLTGIRAPEINVPLILTLTDSSYVNAMGTLTLDNGTIKIRTNAVAGAPVQRIQIGKFTTFIPKPLVL